MRADCTYSRTGEGLHRFVDPADDRVYLYSQFEVPDARRVYTTFEQPDLKAPFTFTRDRARALEGRLQLADARARGRSADGHTARVALPGDQADVDVHHRARRRRVPRGAAHLRTASTATSRSATTAASRWSSTSTSRSWSRSPSRASRSSRSLRLPLPVRQVRPALRAGVQHGRDGERRLRDAARRVPPPQPPGPRVLRVPRRGDPPRDGAHVVRRPGDHEVVGRPLAERVVRRVGLLPRRRRGDRVHRGLDRLHQRPQELGLPPGPAAQHPPDRGRQLRPAAPSRSTSTASPTPRAPRCSSSSSPGSAWRTSSRASAATSRTSSSPTPSSPTCSPRSRSPPAASSSRGRRSGCRPRASTRSRREFELDADGSYALVRGPPDRAPRTTRRCAGTASASACTTRSTAAWSGVPRSRPTSRASSPRSPSWSARSSPTCCCSTRATWPTPRSASTSARWPPSSAASPPSTTRWPGRCAGARPGT